MVRWSVEDKGNVSGVSSGRLQKLPPFILRGPRDEQSGR